MTTYRQYFHEPVLGSTYRGVHYDSPEEAQAAKESWERAAVDGLIDRDLRKIGKKIKDLTPEELEQKRAYWLDPKNEIFLSFRYTRDGMYWLYPDERILPKVAQDRPSVFIPPPAVSSLARIRDGYGSEASDDSMPGVQPGTIE